MKEVEEKEKEKEKEEKENGRGKMGFSFDISTGELQKHFSPSSVNPVSVKKIELHLRFFLLLIKFNCHI